MELWIIKEIKKKKHLKYMHKETMFKSNVKENKLSQSKLNWWMML